MAGKLNGMYCRGTKWIYSSFNVEFEVIPMKVAEESMKPIRSMRQMKGDREVRSAENKGGLRDLKKKRQKGRVVKDAERGGLYSQSGKDGGLRR
jgi:hypothetical protein